MTHAFPLHLCADIAADGDMATHSRGRLGNGTRERWTDRFATRWMPAAILLLVCALPLRAGEANQVWPLPALDDAAAWTAAPKGEKPFTFDCRSESGALFVRFDCAKDNVAELRLKEPVPMPEGVTGFTFLCGNNGVPSSLWVKVLARDAAGKEFAFHTFSRFSFDKGWFSPEHFTRRVCEERFTTPGFGRPKAEPASGATLEGPAPNVKPTPPYTLLGLRFIGGHQGGKFTEFFFRNFAMTRLDPRAAPFYYQFRDVESFGELDPLPWLTPANLGIWGGTRFELSWELRDRYDATPFLVDGKSFEFTQPDWQEKSDGVPYPLQIAQRIEFPIKEKGTYWARVRLRWWYDGKSPLPREISEREFRLDVVNGAEPVKRKPVPADAMAPNCFIRIAPERKSLIFEDDETFAVKLAFRNPGAAVTDATFRAVVRQASGDAEVKALEIVPVWEGEKPFIAELDLNDLKPGVYKLLAEIRSGKQLFDQVERTIARQVPPDKAAAAPIPAAVLSWQELRDGPKPMFHLTPHVPDMQKNSAKAWDEHYRPFLDKAGELSSQVEYNFTWDEVEPLPGVFDWSFVDRFVDYAQSKGLTVQLWPTFRELPEWMTGRYEMSSDGTVFGVTHPYFYLFHGARPNFVHGPEIRGGLVAFIRAVAERYRGHPAVQSYFFCFEHPGDAPTYNWFEGYAPEGVEAFRRAMQAKFGDIRAANQRWGTAYATWDKVAPPPESASSRYRLDWRQFRADAIEGVLKDCVTAIRSADPKRLVMVYGDGAADNHWFSEQGCMSANGGCEKVVGMPSYAACALAGFPQRAEEISVGNWSFEFPTQLDASLFAMMAGGGANAHCKAYVTTSHLQKYMLTDPNVSLGRYKRFMPIWAELRPTELAQPIEAFLAKDCGSVGIYGVISLMQAQVPAACGDGDFWKNGKLLLAIDLEPWRPTEMEKEQIDRLVAYVENGGALLMSADAGRKSVDAPAEDWVLLRRFGVAPPDSEPVPGRHATAVPEPGALFGSDAKPFTLREAWNVKPPEGMETAAFLDGDRQRAAISWKSFGKGKIAILWSQTIIAPLFAKPEAAYPFLRDVARWAGIEPMANATDSRLWTNLLKTKDGSIYYGLAHVGSWQNCPTTGVDTAVRWLRIPAGTYSVTELISGKELGKFTAETLRADGLPVKLQPREVAIFRMARK
jgi:hypothetical protein